jgi:hypothetical protein
MNDQQNSKSDRPDGTVVREDSRPAWPPWYRSDDWWAVWIGGLLLAISLGAVLGFGTSEGSVANPLKPWLAKLGTWDVNPWDSFSSADRSHGSGCWAFF